MEGSGASRPALTLSGWSVDIGDRCVISDVSLSLSEGELLGLIGPNGAGKSTLLRSVIGMPEPSRGSGTVRSLDLRSLRPSQLAKHLALMPQDFIMTFPFTCMDVVMMGRHPYVGRFQRESSDDRRIAESAMARTDTIHLADRLITSLSGGEAQLVSMAKTLAQTTPVLLLDEPTSSLDLRHQQVIFSIIEEYVDSGGSVIASIHDLSLASMYCDRVALLSEGRLVAIGAPADVLRADLLSDVYSTEVRVYADEVSGGLRVLPIGRSPRRGRHETVEATPLGR